VEFAIGLAQDAAALSGVCEAGAPALALALAATSRVADASPPDAEGLEAEPHAARTTPHRITPGSIVDRLGRFMLGNPSAAVGAQHVDAQTQKVAYCDAHGWARAYVS
jgi:hypothetical protein